MKINYYARSNYGSIHYYLLDETQAQLVSNLTRRKTVDRLDLENLALLLGHPDKPAELVQTPDPALAIV